MNIEPTIRDLITRTIHMSLATVRDNKPWVCEVHFIYDDDLNIYFMSKVSRRHSQEIADNPYVSGTIVRQHDKGEFCSGALYYEGQAHAVTDEARQHELRELFGQRLGTPDSAMVDVGQPEGSQFYQITVSNYAVFGKFGDNPIGKYELKWKGSQK